jgi:uncharacterized protein (TIGR03118 family)
MSSFRYLYNCSLSAQFVFKHPFVCAYEGGGLSSIHSQKMLSMKKTIQPKGQFLNSWLLILVPLMLLLSNCKKQMEQQNLNGFQQINLAANNTEYNNAHTDPTLLNAWGLAFSTTGIPWVNAEAGHVSEIYDKEGNILRPPVNIPAPDDPTGGSPTGIVFNSAGANDFMLANNQRAAFLFVGDDGVLSGWNQGAGSKAVRIKDNASSASYTGLAIGTDSKGQSLIYAANFKTGKIDVWDASFASVNMRFTDPNLPSGYAPFNIQNIDGRLYVAYAKVGADGDEEKGVGNGYVSVFDTDGSFIRRFASQGLLNAPWGLAKAPASFFASSADSSSNGNTQPAILVGNFGDGKINAYDLDGSFLGQLMNTQNQVLTIDGLWAISFAPSTATAIDPRRLYFTAGPDDEKDGLFGYIIK